jgi:Uma2 family endonuclease
MAQALVHPHPEPSPGASHDADDIVLLRNVTWGDFQRILEMRGEDPVPRMAYLEGVLELMAPSRTHESIKSRIGCLVEAWCMETGVDITPYGSWLLESKETERGVEPDECYVLGDNPDPARPDLAIEVEWTSRSIDKLQIYRKLGVREVWIWTKGAIAVHTLRGEEYSRIERTELLPGIDLEQLLTFVDIQPMTRAVREYRATLAQASRVPRQ